MGERICTIRDCGKPHYSRGWCVGHYRRWRKYGAPHSPTPLERAFARIVIGDCWEWTGATTPEGYGRIIRDGRPQQAHRWVWEQLVGRIGEGLELDHLCKNRPCVNPDHLEPVTPAENLRRSASRAILNARKTHCVNGHPFNAENTYYLKNRNGRQCRTCARALTNAWRARRRASAGTSAIGGTP